MNGNDDDLRLLWRYHDGELTGDDLAGCRARLEREPLLRQALDRLRELGSGFAADRAAGFAAPAGFTAAVLGAVRRLPDREALRALEAQDRLVALCRRLLLAATVLFALGLLWHSGLFDGRRHDTLQATPDTVDREMERLDAIIRSWTAGGTVPGDAPVTAPRRERDGK